MLTDETIRQHLEGKVTVGLYAINPSNQRCKWVAIDADYKNAMEDLLKLQYRLTQDRVEPALEMSRRGGHLWIFLATPLLARECRIYIHDLAQGLGVPVKGSGLAEGIEVFPKHDAIGAGEYGNAIRGPLGIHRGANRRFWFYGADYTLEDQIAYLKQLRKVTEEELRRFIAGKDRPRPDRPPDAQRINRVEPKRGNCSFRVSHLGAREDAAQGWPELRCALSLLCGLWSRPCRRQPRHPDRRPKVLQVLGWLHQGDDSGRTRLPDSRTPVCLRKRSVLYS